MSNLSYAQIQERRHAAKVRWEKAGITIGTGLVFGLGAHGASNLIRKKIANTVSERLASKIGKVTAQVNTSKENQLKSINNKEDSNVKQVEEWLAHHKKVSKGSPKKVRDARLQDLFSLRTALDKHIGPTYYQQISQGVHPEEANRAFYERRPFQNPVTNGIEYISTAEAIDRKNKGLQEQTELEATVLPGRVYRKASLARPPGQPDADPIVPRKASRPRQTRGRMSKEKIAELRRLVYQPRDIAAARSIVMARAKALEDRKKLKSDYANTSKQMENIHAKLRAYYARRGYTKRRAAIVTGAAGLGGGIVGYQLSNLKKNDPSFANKLQQAFESLKENTQEMIYNVANGLSPFDLQVFQDKLKAALEPLTEYFLKGIADGIASERPKTVNVRFDLLQPVIFSHLDGSRTQLIVNLSEEQRNNITKAITEGLSAGHAPAKIALNIRPTIGLTDNQAQFVANYKNDLVLNKSGALGRALRDKRYDRTVAKAVKSGVPLTQDQINKLVDAYGRKFLAFRANTIARDQSLAAVNLGHVSTIKEVASKHGLMVEKTWIATHDSRTREAHRELDGQTVTGIDTPFQSELGPIRYPYDPQASAADTIQCRCHMKFKLMPMNQIMDVSQ